MSDFVSLSCPSCGGQLRVASNSTSLRCEHCGSEYMVRRESGSTMLESYARCPKCGRNDRVEKVTAIISSHTQQVTQTEQRVEVTIGDKGQRWARTVEVPVTRTQMSDLARRLSPPEARSPVPMPKRPSTSSLLVVGIVVEIEDHFAESFFSGFIVP